MPNSLNIVTVNSITEFKALTTRPDIVQTLGYTTAGDNGGGLWYWVPNSSTTSNDGTVVQLGLH